MAYAGLDVGTSGCKIVVYDLDGRALYRAARRYAESGTDGRRELDPALVADAVFDLLAQVARECPEPMDALAIASLGESMVFLDAQGRSLYPAMLTGDNRGIPETRELVGQVGAEAFLRITGLPPNELYSLPKLLWLRRHTQVLDQARQIFFFEDYLGYLLTGRRMVSYSSACRSMAFDIREKAWSQELLSLAGVDADRLSVPVEAGTPLGSLLPEVAARLGLPPNLRVVAGGHDQSCAALGSGLHDASVCETSMGTCEFMLLMLPGPRFDPTMIDNDFPCIPYVLPNAYLTSLEVTTCGILKTWGRDTLFSQLAAQAGAADFYPALEKRLAGVRTQVLALPQFGSSGNPDLSMDAQGTLTGLTIHTRPEEIYLALLEGISFQLLLAYERARPLGVAPQTIVATGGGAASDAALQMRADIFNLPVARPESEETGTLGCMLLAAVGTGAYPSLAAGIRRAVRYRKTFRPDPESVAYYAAKYRRFEQLYAVMHRF